MHLEKDEKKLERHLREIYSKGVDSVSGRRTRFPGRNRQKIFRQ